jgi:hypothetical protein
MDLVLNEISRYTKVGGKQARRMLNQREMFEQTDWRTNLTWVRIVLNEVRYIFICDETQRRIVRIT